MDKELMERSEELLKRIDRFNKFSSRYQVFPYQEAGKVFEELLRLSDSIPDYDLPQNRDELLQSELKRKLSSETIALEHMLGGIPIEFDTTISMMGIPNSDLTELRNWLESNRKTTSDTIERFFQSRDVLNFDTLNLDNPSVSQKAQSIALSYLQKHHSVYGAMLPDITEVGRFLKDLNAEVTMNERSYFDSLTKTLLIGVPAICYLQEDGNLGLKDVEFLRIYGHEGIGHGLNHIITESSGLPYFLTRDSRASRPTGESIGQFFESLIYEDINANPRIQKALGIEDTFDTTYKESKDTQQLLEYKAKLFHYCITVLADKSLGDPNDPDVIRKKIELIGEVAIDPYMPQGFVEQHRHSFDLEGNLNPQLVNELQYAAQPVNRVLEEFAKQGINYESVGRNLIDATLLTGLWTPIGYVDNARLAAQGK
jgi:hypothetical protein